MDTYTICSQITAKALYDQCLSLRNDTDTGCKNENNEYYQNKKHHGTSNQHHI